MIWAEKRKPSQTCNGLKRNLTKKEGMFYSIQHLQTLTFVSCNFSLADDIARLLFGKIPKYILARTSGKSLHFSA